MRVLWFTNTPSLAVEYLDTKVIGGGWIGSLEAELSKTPSLELGVAFRVFDKSIKPFKINKSTYFPLFIKRNDNKVKQLFSRWNHKVEREDHLYHYLEVIKEFKPDIIHIFGTESEFGLLTAFTEIPCLIYIQGILTVITQKWWSGLSELEVLKYSPKLPLLKGRGLYHDYFITLKAARREEVIYKNNRFYIGRTDWDRRISSVLSPGSRYFHCDEIMRSVFYQSEWNDKPQRDTFTVVSITRKAIYKGLETLLDCAVYLNRFFPSYRIKWRVAGVKNTDEVTKLIERKLKTRFEDMGIILLGTLNEDNLVTEMLQADLFVHPSHTDNSPNSICEAMLLGMPIIATYAGGIPSIILDKEEGLLIQDGDSIALAGAVLELYHNREYAVLLGKKARQKAMNRHSPASIAETIYDIYNAVLRP